MQFEGFLFDIYNFEDEIHLWLIDERRRLRHVTDRFHPVIYAVGPERMLAKLIGRLIELEALASPPRRVRRRRFYENDLVTALEITLTRPSLLGVIRRKLYALYRRLDIYHSDIEIVTGYLSDRGIYPLAPLRVETNDEHTIQKVTPLDRIPSLEYELPPLRIMTMALRYSHRLGVSPDNPLLLETEGRDYRLAEKKGEKLIEKLNEIIRHEDPDVILSAFGDHAIMPHLFGCAQRSGIPLLLDRDRRPPTTRKIITRGQSYMTYGAWLYRAPSYPLFGRWHIDSSNSFVFKESQLAGIIELSRLSRIPPQRLARSSTGTALTAIETETALTNNYLVPWQKSAVEEPKTLYELLKIDKGGLVFVPALEEGNALENVAQLDFSQMYPTIMVRHNISPETVNCRCCRDDENAPRVPEAGYRICLRRRGIVSEALEHVLERRRHYKRRCKESAGREREIYEARQNSLKWMLVTSFGYLGYRNAKFGRIESHESVTAFGREKLLTARDTAEEAGYRVVHAITDCLFIRRPDQSPLQEEELDELARDISVRTGVEMSIDALYSWVVFLPSRADPQLPVVNRYLGRFTDGGLKMRGIAARRTDMPHRVREAQQELLEIMRRAASIAELRCLHPALHDAFAEHDRALERREVPWPELLLRKTASRKREEYRVSGATFLVMEQLARRGIEVQPGEKVRYLVLDRKHPDRNRRYLCEEEATERFGDGPAPYDTDFYRELWWEAYREIWEHFAPPEYFRRRPQAQLFLF